MDAKTFHNLIISEFGLSQFNSEEQLKYIDYIGELVVQGILIKSLPLLNDTHAVELESLIDTGVEPSEMFTFLASNISGFDGLIQAEIASVKNDLTDK